MMRIFKVIFAGWAVAFGGALLLFLGLLWLEGTPTALSIWSPIPITLLFIIGLFVAWRYLK